MGYVLKRLAPGIFLIGLAAAVLLVSDRQHRRRARPGRSASAERSKLPRVAIFQFSSRQIPDESVRGCLDAFAGQNLIGRVFQNPFSGTAPHMTIAENLTLLMATWRKPKLLLLDEHTAALDPKIADQVIHLTRTIVAGAGLTTLMVTHSMHQAVNLGNRLIMMHQGRIIRDISASAKQHLRAEDLLEQFNEVRRAEQLDPGAAEMLKALYI
ncbi:MAG: hypothetical protein Q7J98_03705 [Kiritimatiellia bacterium]|nr:hypothetical protein [Kiritimatiellia bacterium]